MKRKITLVKKNNQKILSKKPEGGITRGKTMQNRLRRVDNFLCRYDPGLIAENDGNLKDTIFIDLGYGEKPFTTLETCRTLRKLNPSLRVLGLEIDPERVKYAQKYSNDLTAFAIGGFNFPLEKAFDGRHHKARIIRLFNVLRQYEESAVTEAYKSLERSAVNKAILIDGTSCPFGRIWTASILRKTNSTGWKPEAMVFSTNHKNDFDPLIFRTILPKIHIHRMMPGHMIYNFFMDWNKAVKETKAMGIWGDKQWFRASAKRLSEYGYPINLKRSWLNKGYLIWYQ